MTEPFVVIKSFVEIISLIPTGIADSGPERIDFWRTSIVLRVTKAFNCGSSKSARL